MFIVFEGIDGAGKSTQLEACAKWLMDKGHSVVRCGDPGSTQLGDHMRELLLNKSDLEIHFRSEMLMYSVARTQLVEEVVRPALSEGRIVLCDRFFYSTLVYQGLAGDVSREHVMAVTDVAIDGVRPDLVLVFDMPPERARKRIQGELDRIESRGMEYMRNVRAGFIKEAELDAAVKVVDSDRPINEIQDDVRRLVAQAIEAA